MTKACRGVVAIVDDDRSIRLAVTRLLAASGYDVIAFASAEDFLDQTPGIDCLILDVHLPGISGLELAGRMWTAGRLTPIVFVTAREDAATKEAVRLTGRPWLRKPFPSEGLLEAVARATTSPLDAV